jgi:hypothetical protein
MSNDSIKEKEAAKNVAEIQNRLYLIRMAEYNADRDLAPAVYESYSAQPDETAWTNPVVAREVEASLPVSSMTANETEVSTAPAVSDSTVPEAIYSTLPFASESMPIVPTDSISSNNTGQLDKAQAARLDILDIHGGNASNTGGQI